MRLLMLCYEFPPLGGGGSRVAFGLSKELARLGYEVDLVTMGFRGLPPVEFVGGVRVHRVRCLRRRADRCTAPEALSYLLAALPAVWRLVRRRRYDFLHAHFIFPDGLIVWLVQRATGVPYVITAHGSDVPGHNPHRFVTAHRLLAPVWNAVVRDAAQLVCPSDRLRSLISASSPEARTTVIPNGINVADFTGSNGDKYARRILIVGRMVEGKGVQHVLAALEGFSKKDYELHIVGDGPYLPALRELAQRQDAVATFWGWLDHDSSNLKTLYETSSIFVLPSEAENFPVVLLEAMASGLAIITTEGTGCAEVVGDAALLVSPKDPGAIKHALSRLIRDVALQRALGAAGRRRLTEHFSWAMVAQQYARLYAEHLIGQGAVTP